MKKIVLYMCLTTSLLASCGKIKASQKADFQGKDITKNVSIIRDKNTKEASLQIDATGKWTVYAGGSVDAIDLSTPLLEGEGSGIFPLNVSDSVRTYFQIVTADGKAILAERHLPMAGGYNFRDLGGYKTQDNRYVKWGKIFRSDDLHQLTDADLNYLAAIPLVSVVDFRSQDEVQRAPDKNPISVKENYAYSISPGNLMSAVSSGLEKLTAQHADELMRDMTVLLVTEDDVVARYRDMFQLLQNEEDVPLMFHCSAGKDRTGMGAVLVLSALGVDEETILNDYMLSNTYLADKYAKYKAQMPALVSLFEVKPEFLKAGLDRIKQDHGSVENYLTKVLNVDIQKMREKYLY